MILPYTLCGKDDNPGKKICSMTAEYIIFNGEAPVGCKMLDDMLNQAVACSNPNANRGKVAQLTCVTTDANGEDLAALT